MSLRFNWGWEINLDLPNLPAWVDRIHDYVWTPEEDEE